MRTTTAAWLFLAMFLIALGAAADEAGSAGGENLGRVFVDSLDVAVVNVDVYVTDKDGVSVEGLTAADFEVFEDGRPVAISNFYTVSDGRHPVSETASPQVPDAETRDEPPARAERIRAPADQRLHLILYFDNQHLRPFNRNAVTRELRAFLNGALGPDDEVMLVTYDRSLHIRHAFTTDIGAIQESLREIETLTGGAVQQATARSDLIRQVERAGSAIDARDDVDFYAKSVYDELTHSLRSLKELVGSLAGLPGRKAVVFVSDGIPLKAGEDMFLLLDRQYRDSFSSGLMAARYSARSQFRELTAHANANRVTLYTLDAGGMRMHTSLSAESAGNSGSRIEIDVAHELNLRQPLLMLAEDTGGLAAVNTNNLAGALASMARDFRSYYSLGYQPAEVGSGRYHEIEVRVRGKGLRVRHRQGYRDKSAETRVADGTLATLLFTRGTNAMGIDVRPTGERPHEDKRFVVPIEVRIPIASITLVHLGEVHQGRLRISVAVLDDQGRLSPVRQEEVPITVPAGALEAARRQVFVYDLELLMRQGSQEIAVGVRDDYPGETSYVRLPVRIGS